MVVGGGDLGEEKVLKLLECDASVVVVSSEVTDRVRKLAEDGAVEWIRRDYEYGDLERAFIAISNTGDPDMDNKIYEEAEERNVILNVVDVTRLCTFIAPSVARRGEVTVATSTGGASPALARTFREKLESSRILEYADLAPILSKARTELRKNGLGAPPDHWQTCITEELLDMVQAGRSDRAFHILMESLLVGSGPIRQP